MSSIIHDLGYSNNKQSGNKNSGNKNSGKTKWKFNDENLIRLVLTLASDKAFEKIRKGEALVANGANESDTRAAEKLIRDGKAELDALQNPANPKPHKYPAKTQGGDEKDNDVLKSQVCVTQKLDGSNCSITVQLIDGVWTIVEIYGKTVHLWKRGAVGPPLGSLPLYGQQININLIVPVMEQFATRLAVTLGVTKVSVYGEAMRDALNNASWHPFGHEIDGKFWRLTPDIHDIYTQCCAQIGQQPSKICPPNVMFVGTLETTIKFFTPTMIAVSIVGTMETAINGAIDDNFEGCVVVAMNGSNLGWKLKAKKHDEQKGYIPQKLADSSDLCDLYKCLQAVRGIPSEENKADRKSVATISQMRATVASAKQQSDKKDKMDAKKLNQEFTKQLDTAAARVMGIQVNLVTMSDAVREETSLSSKIAEMVCIEFKRNYEEADVIPWSDEMILMRAKSVIIGMLKKIPYDPLIHQVAN